MIHVQRSAWYGRVQTLKSKSSRAPVAMPEALLHGAEGILGDVAKRIRKGSYSSIATGGRTRPTKLSSTGSGRCSTS